MEDNREDLYRNIFDEGSYDTSETVNLDVSGVRDRGEFHELIRNNFDVPEYYGNNLDALYDFFTEYFGSLYVRITGIDDVPGDMAGYIERFTDMCRDAAEENPGISFSFDS